MGRYLERLRVELATKRPPTPLTKQTKAPSVGFVGDASGLNSADFNAPPEFNHEAQVRAWLSHIGETDAATVAEVLDLCQTDPAARAYFGNRSESALRRSPCSLRIKDLQPSRQGVLLLTANNDQSQAHRRKT